jgi:tetratricopeptide (TPR) repeat protein
MLTKELTFTLPFVIALYEVFFFKASARDRFKALAPFIITLAIIPILVFSKQGTVNALDSTMRTITAADVTNIPRTDYLFTQLRVIMLYLRLLFFPTNQNVDHDVRVYHSPFALPVLASFIALLALFSLGVYLYRAAGGKKEYPELKLASFGIIWFFLTLSIESSIIPLGELVAEYRLYLPSVGMILAVVSLLFYAARKYSRVRVFSPTFLTVLISVAVVMLATATFLRNTVWSSETALWEDAARKSPARVRPHQNLGTYYGMQGRLEDAKRELILALELEPMNFELHNNLGMVYKKLGAFDDAREEYTTVLKLSPGDVMAHYNLGNLYLAQERLPEAIREYQITVDLIPDYDEAHNNLGIAYQKSGQFEAAIREFNRALQLNPQNEHVRRNLIETERQAEARRQ